MTDEVNKEELVTEGAEEDVVAEEITLNKYKLDVTYYELREGFVVVTAPSENEAVDILMQAVPEGIDDFKVTEVTQMTDEEHEAFTSSISVEPTLH